MARRHGLVKKFCRFNFVSISWKSNLGACSQDIIGFFEMPLHYATLSCCLDECLRFFFLFDVFFFFFFFGCCFLSTLVRRTQTPRRSWITYSFGSPKLIEFLSPFLFGKKKGKTECKNYVFPMRPKTLSFYCFFVLLCNKIPSRDWMIWPSSL